MNEPTISLYIGYKSIESFHFDIEEEYLRGLETAELTPIELENRERQKSELSKKNIPLKEPKTEKKKTFFIQIPIMDPYFKNSNCAFNLKYAFYFRSFKSQSYWMKRNTMIVFDS